MLRLALAVVCAAGATACRQEGSCGTCEGDTVCVGRTCEPAFGRSYVFTIGALTMPPLDNSGGGWDGLTDNTPPDPHVELTLDAAPFLVTPPADNVFTVDFQLRGTATVNPGASLHIAVSDADLNDTFEAAFACDVLLSAAVLQVENLECESPAGDGSVHLSIEPQ
jgi:hypothetical protein